MVDVGISLTDWVLHIWISPQSKYAGSYLIFVIFFTQTRFLENKIYTEGRVNYDKQISRQNSVNRDLWGKANNKCVRNYTLSVGVHLVCVKI